MLQKVLENKKIYDCEDCDKTFVSKGGLRKHKETKHGEYSRIQSEHENIFPEDTEFNEAVEDQELYDFMEEFSKKAEKEGEFSSDELKSLKSEIQRFNTIMQKKMEIQENTTTELDKARGVIATLS